jgi:pimeloyl-ACP methyl ester carboxylesterase
MLPGLLRPLPAAREPDRTWTFAYGEHELAVEEYGELGDPVTVYLHGLLLSSLLNRGLAAALADRGHRVVLLDLLGHGLSSKPPHASYYRFDTFPPQIIALLDELGVESASLGGVSLGANAALWTATQYPDRIRSMVLEMPVLEYGTPAANLVFIPLMLAAHYVTPVLGAVSWAARHVPASRTWLDGVRDAVAQPPEVMTAVLHGLMVGPTAPTFEQREALDVPTLILAHSYDIVHPFSDAKSLARLMPKAEILRSRSIVELRAQPRRLTPEIAEFLDRTVRSEG